MFQYWTWFDASLGAGAPREQLKAVFQALVEFATSPHCLGCMFQLAAADFPEPDHPAHRVARAHKSAVLARLENLAEQAGAAHAAALAAQLFLLMDGAFVATRMFGQESPAAHVGAAAGTLIESAIPPDSP